jgi:uncharacterized protein involved in exopolysaccharide biosynthesis
MNRRGSDNIHKILGILSRRKWLILVVFLLVFTGGTVYAIRLPNTYSSRVLLFIEPKKYSEGYLSQDIVPKVSKRIKNLTELILSREVLNQVIEKYDLFKEKRERDRSFREKHPVLFDILAFRFKDPVMLLRKEIKLVTYKEKEGNFLQIEYSDTDPQLSANVANELATVMIRKDEDFKRKYSEEVAAFMERQLRKAERGELKQKEKELYAFREAHREYLPDQENLLIARLSNLQFRSSDIKKSIEMGEIRKQQLEGDIGLLRIQLRQEETRRTSEGLSGIDDLRTELEFLRKELSQLEVVESRLANLYTEKHPDLIEIRQSIKTMKEEIQQKANELRRMERSSTSPGAKEDSARKEGEEKETIPGDASPLKEAPPGKEATPKKQGAPKKEAAPGDASPAAAERPLVAPAAAQKDATPAGARQAGKETVKGRDEWGNNPPRLTPALIQLQALLSRLERESRLIQSLIERQEEINDEIMKVQIFLSKIPEIKRKMLVLEKEYLDKNRIWEGLMEELRNSQITLQIEKLKKGERLMIVEPAAPPEFPSGPNRTVIVILSLFLAMAGALAAASLREQLDRSMKSAADLEDLTELPVLIVIPHMSARHNAGFLQRRAGRHRRKKGREERP